MVTFSKRIGLPGVKLTAVIEVARGSVNEVGLIVSDQFFDDIIIPALGRVAQENPLTSMTIGAIASFVITVLNELLLKINKSLWINRVIIRDEEGNHVTAYN